MTRTTRTIPILVAALLAALAAGVLAVVPGSGSSHREAPLTSIDPTGDDTDLYAFTAADAPDALTVVANWIPFEDPAGGPNFYRFDDRREYYINVDNTGDGKYDVRYQFKFKTKVRNPDSFLYALPGVSSISDSKLNVVQTYNVTRETYKNGKLTGSKRRRAAACRSPQQRRAEDDPGLRVGRQRRRSSRCRGGGKVFAGQVDDPFFVDLGTTFDAINFRNGTGNAGGGKDDLAGYNVHSIVLQVPEADVTRDGKAVADAEAANAVVGVWSSTERHAPQVTAPARRARRQRRPGQPPGQPAGQRGRHPAGEEGLLQRDAAGERPARTSASTCSRRSSRRSSTSCTRA